MGFRSSTTGSEPVGTTVARLVAEWNVPTRNTGLEIQLDGLLAVARLLPRWASQDTSICRLGRPGTDGISGRNRGEERSSSVTVRATGHEKLATCRILRQEPRVVTHGYTDIQTIRRAGQLGPGIRILRRESLERPDRWNGATIPEPQAPDDSTGPHGREPGVRFSTWANGPGVAAVRA